MHILIAPDSFKGTLRSREAAEAIAAGLAESLPDAQTRVLPLSDGGEGLVTCMLDALGGERRSSVVSGKATRASIGSPGRLRSFATKDLTDATVPRWRR